LQRPVDRGELWQSDRDPGCSAAGDATSHGCAAWSPSIAATAPGHTEWCGSSGPDEPRASGCAQRDVPVKRGARTCMQAWVRSA